MISRHHRYRVGRVLLGGEVEERRHSALEIDEQRRALQLVEERLYQDLEGHNYIGRNYIGHNYLGHNYLGHNY